MDDIIAILKMCLAVSTETFIDRKIGKNMIFYGFSLTHFFLPLVLVHIIELDSTINISTSFFYDFCTYYKTTIDWRAF